MKWHNLRKNPTSLPNPKRSKIEYVILVKLKNGDYARDLGGYTKDGWFFVLFNKEEVAQVIAWHRTLDVPKEWIT